MVGPAILLSELENARRDRRRIAHAAEAERGIGIIIVLAVCVWLFANF